MATKEIEKAKRKLGNILQSLAFQVGRIRGASSELEEAADSIEAMRDSIVEELRILYGILEERASAEAD